MKCSKIVDKYLDQEDMGVVPFRVRLHALRCSRCRQEIAQLRKEIKKLRTKAPFDMKRDLSDNIMYRIGLTIIHVENRVSIAKWLSVGLVIFASIVLFSYSDYSIWVKEHFGSSFDIPMSMVLGLLISAYVLLFIGTNMEQLKKVFNYTDKNV